jgi:hypothetical protein
MEQRQPNKSALKLPQLITLKAEADTKLADVVAKKHTTTRVNESSNRFQQFKIICLPFSQCFTNQSMQTDQIIIAKF